MTTKTKRQPPDAAQIKQHAQAWRTVQRVDTVPPARGTFTRTLARMKPERPDKRLADWIPPHQRTAKLGVFRPTEIDAFWSIRLGYLVTDSSLGRLEKEVLGARAKLSDHNIRCRICHRSKPAFDNFSPDSRNRIGYDTRCHACRREQWEERQQRRGVKTRSNPVQKYYKTLQRLT